MTTEKRTMRFMGDDLPFQPYQVAKVVVLPIPYERTTSYIKGTVSAPQKIIEASAYVELYDEEIGIETSQIGIFTAQPIVDLSSETTEKDCMSHIEGSCDQHLGDEKFCFSLGGEHTVSFPLIKSHLKRYPKLSILHIDAHADLKDRYEGNELSHASVLKRVRDLSDEMKMVHVGVRSISQEEAVLAEQKKWPIYFAHEIFHRNPTSLAKEINSQLSDQVYLTIDADGFDPSLIPAVGTPEPGGLLWPFFFELMREIVAHKKIVGIDLVELCPIAGQPLSDFICAKLVYKLLGYTFFANRL
jgi:agmatinase